MIIMKFGGTSVANADQIRRVGKLIKERRERRPIVVVSAVGGVTDRFFRLVESILSPQRRKQAKAQVQEILELHRSVVEDLSLPKDLLDQQNKEFVDLTRGMLLIRECTPRTLDYLVSFGERWSARIVSAHLRSEGIASSPCDAFDVGLVTDARFGSARPLPGADSRIRFLLEKVDGIPVITGYIGRNEKGEITTLGRGGSDYSASIFGAAVGAEEIQIWTDVDGVMTADPRIVKGALDLKKVSFAEASELAFYGAKVIHPQTMVPAMEHDIPIRVLNTLRPEFEGTLIVHRLEDNELGLKSVTSKDHIAVVNILAAPMLYQYGFMAKISEVFARYEVVIDMIATSEVSVSMTTDQWVNLEPVVEDLSKFSDVAVQRDRSIISLVGEGIRSDLDFAARVFDIVAREKAPIEMISYGATGRNLSFLTSSECSKRVVGALHQRLLAKA